MTKWVLHLPAFVTLSALATLPLIAIIIIFFFVLVFLLQWPKYRFPLGFDGFAQLGVGLEGEVQCPAVIHHRALVVPVGKWRGR